MYVFLFMYTHELFSYAQVCWFWLTSLPNFDCVSPGATCQNMAEPHRASRIY